jgi:hypothetical protein
MSLFGQNESYRPCLRFFLVSQETGFDVSELEDHTGTGQSGHSTA